LTFVKEKTTLMNPETQTPAA